MANPFPSRFNSNCQSCGDFVLEGDKMFAVDGMFVCEDCADAGENICDCGSFKSSDYETCYDCYQDQQDDEF